MTTRTLARYLLSWVPRENRRSALITTKGECVMDGYHEGEQACAALLRELDKDTPPPKPSTTWAEEDGA